MELKYMPIFRCKQEEIKLLKSFNFEDKIFPCVEIYRELPRKNTANSETEKNFQSEYGTLIQQIRANHVFIDIPIQLKSTRRMPSDVISFLNKVAQKRTIRTEYLNKLTKYSGKIIPIISTYSEVTGEKNSIELQENDLRKTFPILGFRTFFNTFSRDIIQIKKVVKKTDYVIMDWNEEVLDLKDADHQDIIEEIKEINCPVIIHRSAIPKNIKMADLIHESEITQVSNNLLELYSSYGGSAFSDYAGIKKGSMEEGGVISPGFIYYDAISNSFFGYRYEFGSHKKGERLPNLSEFETRIVPAVINSVSTSRMLIHSNGYLNTENAGWITLCRIEKSIETGRNAAKFTRISMEHYLHCIKQKIKNGQFDQV